MKIFKFIHEVQSELHKVTWPTREQNIRYTLIVIGISAAVGVYLSLLDSTFSKILTQLIK